MKHIKVEVGQTVKVKKTLSYKTWGDTFEVKSKGRVGTVARVEPLDFKGTLSVLVRFTDNACDWGNHKDIKLIKDVD